MIGFMGFGVGVVCFVVDVMFDKLFGEWIECIELWMVCEKLILFLFEFVVLIGVNLVCVVMNWVDYNEGRCNLFFKMFDVFGMGFDL